MTEKQEFSGATFEQHHEHGEKQDRDWEQRFDVLAGDCRVIHVHDTEQYKALKEFVAQELASARQAGYEEGKQQRARVASEDAYESGYDAGRQAALEEVEAALPPERTLPKRLEENSIGQRDAYRGMNSYRFDVIKILSTLKKKGGQSVE